MRIRIDFDKITEREKGYLCGFYVGDGNIFIYPKQWIYRLRFHTYVNEIHIQNNLVKICSKLCNNIRRYKAKNTVVIEIHSKDLLAAIDEHVTKNGLRNLRAPISFRKGFIEGMIDSDGYVQRKYAEITTLNKKLKSNLISVLRTLHTPYNVRQFKSHLSKNQGYRIGFSLKYEQFFPMKWTSKCGQTAE